MAVSPMGTRRPASGTGADVDNDTGLLNRARAGDVAAFSTLIKSHDERMRGLAWQLLGDQAAMDDALQNAYLNAWRRLDSLHGASFGAWLWRIVHNTCIDIHRSRSRHATVSIETVAEPHIEVDTATRFAERSALREALLELPVDQMTAIVLVDAEGFSYEAAANHLDVPVGTVASRVNRARRAMRVRLSAGGLQ